MHVITFVAMLIVVAAFVSTLLSERMAAQLRPVRIKVRREDENR